MQYFKIQVSERKVQSVSPAEPTYRLEPELKFDKQTALTKIKQLTDTAISGAGYYNTDNNSQNILILTDRIKHELRRQIKDRYRIVVMVTMSEMNSQGLQVASKCLWSELYDTYVSYQTTHNNLCCVVNVYAVYKD